MNIGTLILDSRVMAAPMAGVIDISMRILLREYGAALVFTEMISVEGIVRKQRGSVSLITCDPRETPLGVQLFGKTPASFTAAAVAAEERGAALIDINMGCPVKKVVRQGGGAALLHDPRHCAEIVRSVRSAVSIPVTAKIRAGWDEPTINYREIGLRLQDAGADAVIIHPRTVVQFFSGQADWSMVAELAGILSIPVVGSGDIIDYADAERRLTETGAAYAMIGRGCLGRPWVFSPNGNEPLPDEKVRIIGRHRELIDELYHPRKASGVFKRHCLSYLKAFPFASAARSVVVRQETTSDIMGVIEEYCAGTTPYHSAPDDGVIRR